jgi:hypothetical protein
MKIDLGSLAIWGSDTDCSILLVQDCFSGELNLQTLCVQHKEKGTACDGQVVVLVILRRARTKKEKDRQRILERMRTDG